MTLRKPERTYIAEVKGRLKNGKYLEGYVTLHISLPADLVGKRVKIHVKIEPLEQ